jgi:hypothetical protein|tara:strand:+ start:2380 stop:4086 length:1707 start_codon:yes stop_codon:yes gene_type:complete
MPLEVKEIKELAKYLTGEVHQGRVAQQKADDSYRDDEFGIPFLPADIPRIKTGKAYRMVSTPAEHIITSNPQVFREPTRANATEAASDLAIELNRWAKLLLRQSPQPYKESVKKTLGKGESWQYWIHNNDFDPKDPNSLPFNLIIPDPTVIYMDTEAGEVNGVPRRVVFSYERVAQNIKQNYPKWLWTKRRNRKMSSTVPFMMYWDDDIRYIEADGDPLILGANGEPFDDTGIQPNIYGFVPMTHGYSGFGEDSPSGDPKTLAIGRVTKIRDLIAEYTAIRSVIDYLTYTYATPPLDLLYDPERWTPPPGWAESYDRGPMAVNTVPITPGGDLRKGVDMLPDQALYAYLFKIDADINAEDPLGQVGSILGTSGRQDDIAQEASLRRYDTVVENTAHQFATGFGLVMKMIEKLPHIKPSGIKMSDIGGNYNCTIELKSEDPIAQDRLSQKGSRMYQQGEISLKKNLITYQGMTDKEAEDELASILVDNATRNNPIIAQLMGVQLAREAGFEQEYQALLQQGGLEGTIPGQPQTGSQGGQPRVNNQQTPQGINEADLSLAQRGVRRSPSG